MLEISEKHFCLGQALALFVEIRVRGLMFLLEALKNFRLPRQFRCRAVRLGVGAST